MLTKITRYKKTGKKRTTVHASRRKIRGSLLRLVRSVILCTTPESVDAATALAEVVSREGMNNANYLLFMTLLETNSPYVVDALVGPRNPFLLFSPIKPNWFLLRETFRILAKFKGNELSLKVLLALLGIVQNAYKTSKDGYRIYPLKMSDVYNIGKHLDKERDQLDPRNRLLLEILFDIYFVGIDSEERSTKQIGIKANDIRVAFFDNTKRMIDAIPDVLLVKDFVRQPVAPKAYHWMPPAQSPAALEAREEPEVKVTIQRERERERAEGPRTGQGTGRRGGRRPGAGRPRKAAKAARAAAASAPKKRAPRKAQERTARSTRRPRKRAAKTAARR